MCSVCLHSPCDPRCPNAPEPEVVTECFCCEEPIRAGQEYIDFDGDAICLSCCETMTINDLCQLVDMTVEEILCKLGGERKVGEPD